jgi:hypothetical protein
VQIEGQAAAPEDCMITAHVKGTTLSQDLVVRADNSGCYRFPAVLPGKVEITVTVAAAQGAAERRKNATLDIPEGQTVRQDFTFSGLGGIRGTVAGLAPDQNGGALLLIAGELSQPLASFEDIANLRKRVLMDTSVDQSGAFEFSGLDPGVYTIVTVAANDSSPQNGTAIPNMRMASAVVSVAPNADTVVNLVFK